MNNVHVNEINKPSKEAVEAFNQTLTNYFLQAVENARAKRTKNNEKGDSHGSSAQFKVGNGSRQHGPHVSAVGGRRP